MHASRTPLPALSAVIANKRNHVLKDEHAVVNLLLFTTPDATTFVTNDDISSLGTPSSSHPFLSCLVVMISATGDARSRLFARKKSYENFVVQPRQRCHSQFHAASLDVL